MKIQNTTNYLLVNHNPQTNEIFVEIHDDYSDALKRMSSSTRISPIFPINRSKKLDLVNIKKCWILFFGPIYPGDVFLPDNLSTYLTLGLYNFVAIAQKKSDLNRLKLLPSMQNIPWEEWVITKGKIEKSENFLLDKLTASDHHISQRNMRNNNLSLKSAYQEYETLYSSIINKAKLLSPVLFDELIIFDKQLINDVRDDELDINFRHGILANANAALSHSFSQMHSGTSPILWNPCPLSLHSLLGIGTASLALAKIRRFIDKILNEAMLVKRLANIITKPPADNPLYQISEDNSFWNIDHLALTDSEYARLFKDNESDHVFPLVTYFSRRDGFHSNWVSLSAPMELLNCCNTVAWSPIILTHEISHTVIDKVLPILLPRPDQIKLLDRIMVLLSNPKEADTLFEQIQELLAFAVWQLGGNQSDESIDADILIKLIQEQAHNINEILTDCFNYLYFYLQKPYDFVRSTWISWEVIPGIHDRISEYLTRTLCALHTNNLGIKNGYSLSISSLIKFLERVQMEYPKAKYVEKALPELKNNKENYINKLQNRCLLIRFARHFLYSPQIETIFRRDRITSGRVKKTYPFQYPKFVAERVVNPLQFIDCFACNKRPNSQKAIWMLQQLAHSE